MAVANDGTILIEEADKLAGKDGNVEFEKLLICRHAKATAKARYMAKTNHDNWERTIKPMFGPTALHRRSPYADAALESRNITVELGHDSTRPYIDPNSVGLDNDSCVATMSDLTFETENVEVPLGISPRIFDTYRPLVQSSITCNDIDFLPSLMSRLKNRTLEFEWEASVEPRGLVVRAVLNIVSNSSSFANIKFATIRDCIYENHRISFASRQIGVLLRQVGLTTKESHGMTVVVPTPGSLLRACRAINYEDEEMAEELKAKIPGFRVVE